MADPGYTLSAAAMRRTADAVRVVEGRPWLSGASGPGRAMVREGNCQVVRIVSSTPRASVGPVLLYQAVIEELVDGAWTDLADCWATPLGVLTLGQTLGMRRAVHTDGRVIYAVLPNCCGHLSDCCPLVYLPDQLIVKVRNSPCDCLNGDYLITWNPNPGDITGGGTGAYGGAWILSGASTCSAGVTIDIGFTCVSGIGWVLGFNCRSTGSAGTGYKFGFASNDIQDYSLSCSPFCVIGTGALADSDCCPGADGSTFDYSVSAPGVDCEPGGSVGGLTSTGLGTATTGHASPATTLRLAGVSVPAGAVLIVDLGESTTSGSPAVTLNGVDMGASVVSESTPGALDRLSVFVLYCPTAVTGDIVATPSSSRSMVLSAEYVEGLTDHAVDQVGNGNGSVSTPTGVHGSGASAAQPFGYAHGVYLMREPFGAPNYGTWIADLNDTGQHDYWSDVSTFVYALTSGTKAFATSADPVANLSGVTASLWAGCFVSLS